MICLLAALIVIIAESRTNPLFVTYVDFPTCTGSIRDAACLANMAVPGYATHPYNVVNYAFMVPEWANPLADATAVWNNPSSYLSSSIKAQLTGSSSASNSQIRTAIKKKFSDAGVKLLLSVFGGTSHPMGNFPAGTLTNPGGLVDRIKEVVVGQLYDGVDIDFEQTAHFQDQTAEAWLCELTNGLREALGSSYIITHAPQAPYMGASYSANNPAYPNGGYLKVHQQCGSKIDWYNVQFYNQGGTTYDSFETLFTASNGWSGTTAVYQIINGQNYNGGLSIPADKLVVGKFIRQGTDGSAGWISASNMKAIFETALSRSNPSWNTGFMTWQYIGDKESNFAWSNTVSSAWENSNGGSGTSSPTTTTATTAATTSSGGGNNNGGGGGGGTKIRVTMYYNSNWWMTFYLSNTGGASIRTIKMKPSNGAAYIDVASSWSDTNVGTVYGFSVDPYMKAPFSIKIISSSNQEIIGNDIITSRAAGASGTMTQSFGSPFTDDGDEDGDNDGISWTVWVAIAVCVIIVIGCIVGFVYYKKNKQKKEVTFDAKDGNGNEIEIDGVGNDAVTANTQI